MKTPKQMAEALRVWNKKRVFDKKVDKMFDDKAHYDRRKTKR